MDEASRVEGSVYKALRPMLAVGNEPSKTAPSSASPYASHPSPLDYKQSAKPQHLLAPRRDMLLRSRSDIFHASPGAPPQHSIRGSPRSLPSGRHSPRSGDRRPWVGHRP